MKNFFKPGNKLTAALRNKTILLISSGVLLTVLLIGGAAAWYTRVSTVEQLSMEAAKFDFRANYNGEYFDLYAHDYLNIALDTATEINDVAAPGTLGVIPLRISADESEADVKYNLRINISSMAPTLREHIRFFYYPKGSGDPVSFGTNTEAAQINGTLKHGEANYEFIYWEWVYQLGDDYWYQQESTTGGTKTGGMWMTGARKTTDPVTKEEVADPFTEEEKAAYDEIDTNIGLGKCDEMFVDPLEYTGTQEALEELETGKQTEGVYWPDYTTDAEGKQVMKAKAYQVAMLAKIDITGAMAEPKKLSRSELDQLAAKLEKITSETGSRYVDPFTIPLSNFTTK